MNINVLDLLINSNFYNNMRLHYFFTPTIEIIVIHTTIHNCRRRRFALLLHNCDTPQNSRCAWMWVSEWVCVRIIDLRVGVVCVIHTPRQTQKRRDQYMGNQCGFAGVSCGSCCRLVLHLDRWHFTCEVNSIYLKSQYRIAPWLWFPGWICYSMYLYVLVCVLLRCSSAS